MHAILLAIAISLAPTQTGLTEQDLVGSYKGAITLPKDLSKKEREMAQKFLKSMTLRLNRDGSFVLGMMINIEGTYILIKDIVYLRPTMVMGKDLDEFAEGQMGEKPDDLILYVRDKGRRLVAADETGPAMITFRRK
jgi:hypothetical protein